MAVRETSLSQPSALSFIHSLTVLLLALPFSVSNLYFAALIVSGKNDGQNEGLGLLIFLAILLHKAPAAIGFGTFLQHEGIS
jgi:hypothetical protein